MKKTIILFICIFAAAVFAAEPVLRVGLMTDTHVNSKKTSCRFLKEALILFKHQKVDMIVNLGDIANVYEEPAYKNYRDTVKEVFGNSAPEEIFVFANHDRIKREKESVWKVFEDVKKHLECKNSPYDVIKRKGYTFLVIPQFVDSKKYIDMMDKAVQENPGKPIFVLDHVPAFDTVYHSKTWGEGRRRKILNKYPQAVQLSGHVHGTLTNERNIWQGEFTAVNAGSLEGWTAELIGGEPVPQRSDMVMILEIYPEKLLFRRFFSTTKEEYAAATPWSVPLPFDPKNAPYTIARRKAESKAPDFAVNAKVKVQCGEKNVKISYPGVNDAFFYKVELFRKDGGTWQRYVRKDFIGEFMKPEAKRAKNINSIFDIGYFEPGQDYRAKITAVNAFGKEGNSITGNFTVKKRAASTVVWESKNPMKECPFMSGLAGGKPFKTDKDGFYIHDRFEGRLVFPENVWQGKRGTKFRFTIEMHTIQNTTRQWTLCLRNPNPLKNANLRIATEPGDSGVQRYVITFTKAKDFFNFYLLIREGGKGKIRFDYVKIERLDNK